MTTVDRIKIVDVDWASMSLAEKIYHLEVEGYVVLPGLLDETQIARLRSELADLPMINPPGRPAQTFAESPPQWHSRTFCELIGNPPTVGFLQEVLGPEIVFTLGHFIQTGPGANPIPLHADIKPHGTPFGPAGTWGESPPVMVRVLYYLDDLKTDRALFRIVPRSHISLHKDANPYLQYDAHPGEVAISVKAGDAILFHVAAFHGTHANTSDIQRSVLEYAYRPIWAKPHGDCEEWPANLVANAPEQAKPFLRPLNEWDRAWDERKNPPIPGDTAAGIDPARWGR